MNTTDNTGWTTPATADEHLEAALRAEAEHLRAMPAPHLVPRVLETIRTLPASPARQLAAPARHAWGRPSTWWGVAVAALAAIILSVGPTVLDDAPDTVATPEPVARTQPLQRIAPWLADTESTLLSQELEQPLLDEVGGLTRDAERVAAAFIEPLLRSLIQLQLRPSVHAATGQSSMK